MIQYGQQTQQRYLRLSSIMSLTTFHFNGEIVERYGSDHSENEEQLDLVSDDESGDDLAEDFALNNALIAGAKDGGDVLTNESYLPLSSSSIGRRTKKVAVSIFDINVDFDISRLAKS